MPKTIILPNPDSATTIGASLVFTRNAAGAAGVGIMYNPANGDSPFETTALTLSATERTQLAGILATIDAAMRTARGYT